MRKIVLGVLLISTLVSCKEKTGVKKFVVKGTIGNNQAKVIYLEEIPMTTMRPSVVDSVIIGKDGKYELKTGASEEKIYNLRLDEGKFPMAAVINDAESITVDASFSKENTQFIESYDVKGSAASKQMKEFLFAFNSNLQAIYYNDKQYDSLQKAGGKDSILNSLQVDRLKSTAAIRTLFIKSLAESKSPALTMFEVAYFQNTANNPNYQVQGLTKEEVVQIVNDAVTKFPTHKGLASIKSSLQGWVGKDAPEISLPDANGKEVKLSSFKGKYVLVDFWASWCQPCRMENPNVVNAYNKYKDKNFTVLGVSLDKPGEKDQWMKAVMQDGLAWTQVSELKEWESSVVYSYGFAEKGIPYNVLVDPNGKIIAEALHGPELEAKLAEVLK